MPEVFHIIPASNRAAIILAAVALLVLVVLVGSLTLLGATKSRRETPVNLESKLPSGRRHHPRQ